MFKTLKTILSRLIGLFRTTPPAVPQTDNRPLLEIHAEMDARNKARFFPGGQADLSKCCLVHVLRGKINEMYFLNHFGTWTVIFESADHRQEVCGRCGKQGHRKDACTKKAKMFKPETLLSIIDGGKFVTHYVTPKIRHRNEEELKDSPRYAYLIDMQKAS